MMSAGETIAALSTPGGTGAVALIRISGADAGGVIGRACRRATRFPDRRATLASVLTPDGQVLDRTLITRFAAPHSYTGEEVVEVSTHGGRLVTRRVLERLLDCGARVAGPGEFTERAFLNGKLDLTQAEAVMDLISAQSDLALRAAHEQLDGGIGRRTEALRKDLIDTVAQLEAWIDFPEEDIDPASGQALIERISTVERAVADLLATADQGRILREGLRTVICGRPNAGKSSLLNALLGLDRAIVSETAGTTRDTIEEMLVVAGVPLRVVDTAGLHRAGDGIEKEGIRRTLSEAKRADLLLVVADATLPPARALPKAVPEGPRRILVLNKADLPEAAGWDQSDAIRVCSLDGRGLDALRRRILELAELGEADWGEQSVAINARHRDCLGRARGSLAAALGSRRAGEDPEITALSLHEALDFLGEIAGRVDTEEILGSIFSQFCIGK